MKIILLWNFVIIPGAINRVIKTMCVWCEMFAHIEWSCVHVFMNVGEMYHKMWISIDMQLLGVVDSIFVWGNEGIKKLCDIFRTYEGCAVSMWVEHSFRFLQII